MAATTSILQSTQPAFFFNGQENTELAQHLLSLEVHDSVQGMAHAEVRIGNWGAKNGTNDFLYLDRETLEFGKTMQIKVGNDTFAEGRIMAIEAVYPESEAPQIAVLLEDQFQDLRMTRRTRSFTDMTDDSIFQQLANDHSLQPQVDVSGPTHKHVAQINQSDLAFLRERARSLDAELWLDGSTLHVQQHDRRTGNSFAVSMGRNLHEFRVTADLSRQRTSVAVTGWDVSGKQAVNSQADDSAISSELGSLTSGVSILQDKLGARKESLAHLLVRSDDEGQAVAKAFFRIGARRFVVGHGVADPSPDLKVGAFIDLQNVGSLFGGKYYVSAVRHVFDRVKGMRTCFTAERAGLGQAA